MPVVPAGHTTMIPEPARQDRPLRRSARRRLRRSAAVVAVAVAVCAGAGFAVRGWLAGGRSVDASRLRIATVTRGPFVRDVVADGRLVSAHSPTLYAIAAGTVAVRVVAGDRVNKGQVLAVIDSPELKNQLLQEQAEAARLETEVGRARLLLEQQREQAQKTFEQAQIDHRAAARDVQRLSKAHKVGVISDLDYLHAEDSLKKATVELKDARKSRGIHADIATYNLKAKRLELEHQRAVVADLTRKVAGLTLRSPVRGQVGQILVDQGASVAAQAPVLTVVGLSSFELKIQVPEAFARDVAPGMTAEIRGDAHTYPARVRAVSPEVVGGQVACRLAFTGAHPSGLRLNQQMSARVLLDRKSDALQVERGPSVTSGDGYAYFVHDGVAERRPLRTGVASLTAVEILAGARPGDRIVISGAELFGNAERVRIADH